MDPTYHEIYPAQACGACTGTGSRMRHGRVKPRCLEPHAMVLGAGRRGRYWIYGDCGVCRGRGATGPHVNLTQAVAVWAELVGITLPEPCSSRVRGVVFSGSSVSPARAVIEGEEVFAFAAEGYLNLRLDAQAAAE